MTQQVHAAAVAVKVKLAEEFVTEVGTCTHSNRVQFVTLAVLLEATCKATAVRLAFVFFGVLFFCCVQQERMSIPPPLQPKYTPLPLLHENRFLCQADAL